MNVATHLLRDVFKSEVDNAIVDSNYTDLALPLKYARSAVPLETMNPPTNYLAGALKGSPTEGAGRHWWK